MTDTERRVLSIQSTVVHGYAGGRSAVFPLQLHGFEVDAINTVQFSNHTRYNQWTGFRTTAEQVLDLFQGLQNSGLDNFQYLLTGYLPSAAAVEAIGTIAKKLKTKNPEIIWILDPVMGDDGELYVAAEVVPIYKSIIPYADVILPNQYEAEWLSDCKLDSLDSISPSLKKLHQLYRVKNIVISSLRLPSHPDVILCCGSTGTSALEPRPFIIEAPVIDGPFVGTGDLFAALLLARLHPYAGELTPADTLSASDLPLAKALQLVIASMQGVLKKTKLEMDRQLQDDGYVNLLDGKERQIRVMRAAELRLVGSQKELLHPEVLCKIVSLA